MSAVEMRELIAHGLHCLITDDNNGDNKLPPTTATTDNEDMDKYLTRVIGDTDKDWNWVTVERNEQTIVRLF
jgi:hypothetical protein